MNPSKNQGKPNNFLTCIMGPYLISANSTFYINITCIYWSPILCDLLISKKGSRKCWYKSYKVLGLDLFFPFYSLQNDRNLNPFLEGDVKLWFCLRFCSNNSKGRSVYHRSPPWHHRSPPNTTGLPKIVNLQQILCLTTRYYMF